MEAVVKKGKAITSEDVILNVIKAALLLPGARIDRDSFLRKQFSNYVKDKELLENIVKQGPPTAGISQITSAKVAKGCIKREVLEASAEAFALGLPGGWWLAATVPTDVTQYFYNCIQLIQKLAYIYGWPSLFDSDTDSNEIDDETLYRFVLFLGLMFGVGQAAGAIKVIAIKVAEEVTKRLPRQALTKVALFNISRTVLKYMGVKLTKEIFTKAVGKAIPVLGGFLNGGMTLAIMGNGAESLRKHLYKLPVAYGSYSDELVTL